MRCSAEEGETMVEVDDVERYKIQRRGELAKQYYNDKYENCCWKQRDAINSAIAIELDKSAGG